MSDAAVLSIGMSMLQRGILFGALACEVLIAPETSVNEGFA